ncbi:hypothetical protein HYV56_02085 [Candidatus Peregrinibacteria bacterium]|nr:hypothetical protein [Candidatus Peregrinibacteria bacterium]
MLKLLDPRYLFGLDPGPSFSYYIHLIIFFAVIFIGGIVVRAIIVRNKDKVLKKVMKRYPRKLYIVAGIGFFLIFMRNQGIPLLSMRIFLILNILGIFYIIGKTIYAYKKIYPLTAKKFKEKEEKTKYLP